MQLISTSNSVFIPLLFLTNHVEHARVLSQFPTTPVSNAHIAMVGNRIDNDASLRLTQCQVELIAGMGLSDNPLLEATCKQYFTVEKLLSILSSLSKKSNQRQAFSAYLHLLYSVHVSTLCRLKLNHIMNLRADPRIWTVLQVCCDILQSCKTSAQSLDLDAIDYREIDSAIYVILPFIREFLKGHYTKLATFSTASLFVRSTTSLPSDLTSYGFDDSEIVLPLSDTDVAAQFKVSSCIYFFCNFILADIF